VSDVGSIILIREEQSSKAIFSMVLMEVGSAIEEREEHRQKARLPMVVRDDDVGEGSVMLERFVRR